jgi:hypothetical protein
MKKRIWPLLFSTLFLFSCAHASASSKQDEAEISRDVASLSSLVPSGTLPDDFSASLIYEYDSSASLYRYSFTLSKSRKDFPKIKVILHAPSTVTYFPEGYTSDLTLVKEDGQADPDKGLVRSLYLYFSLPRKNDVECYIRSGEEVFFFTLSPLLAD